MITQRLETGGNQLASFCPKAMKSLINTSYLTKKPQLHIHFIISNVAIIHATFSEGDFKDIPFGILYKPCY